MPWNFTTNISVEPSPHTSIPSISTLRVRITLIIPTSATKFGQIGQERANPRKRFCNQWSMWYSDPSLSGQNRICRCMWVYLYMPMYVCACIGIYAHIYMSYILNRYYDTFAVAVTPNVPTVLPFTVREGSFTDYIAEEMQRKFIKDRKTWECFSLTMFRRLPGSTNKFRCIQHCDTLHLQNSACLCNHFRLTVNIPNKRFFILILNVHIPYIYRTTLKGLIYNIQLLNITRKEQHKNVLHHTWCMSHMLHA